MLVALTGGIATGKSTVKTILEQHHIPVIDLDVIAHQASDDPVIIQRVQNELGFDIKQQRKELGAYILEHPEAKIKLEAILHPYVYQKMEEHIARLDDQIIVVDVPLLFETGKQGRFDVVAVVYACEEKQIERLMKRNNISYQEALKWVQSQIPIEEKRQRADIVFDNSGTINDLKKQLSEVLKQWKE